MTHANAGYGFWLTATKAIDAAYKTEQDTEATDAKNAADAVRPLATQEAKTEISDPQTAEDAVATAGESAQTTALSAGLTATNTAADAVKIDLNTCPLSPCFLLY